MCFTIPSRPDVRKPRELPGRGLYETLQLFGWRKNKYEVGGRRGELAFYDGGGGTVVKICALPGRVGAWKVVEGISTVKWLWKGRK